MIPNIENFSTVVVDRQEDYLDTLHEECGVVGIARIEIQDNLAHILSNGLFTIQHRGQEAAGVGVFDSNDPESVMIVKGLGLVSEVLGGHDLNGVHAGNLGSGQVRYGTVGVNGKGAEFDAAQPARAETLNEDTITLVHNGNLTNLEKICANYNINYDDYTTDSLALIAIIAIERSNHNTLTDSVIEVLKSVEGAYSLIVQGESTMVAARDPYGFRPLMLGTYDDGGFAVASESHTLTSLGAKYQREVSRGEVLTYDQTKNTMSSQYPFEEQPSKLCAFEFVYFSGPHGELDSRSVHMVRKNMGKILAEEHPVDADLVIGVPDSGIPASEGFAEISGISKCSALVKNRYISRTFIAPNQTEREDGVLKKFQIIVPEIYGKKIVLVDDSIVRGTTMKKLVEKLTQVGAAEVHLRITSAPYKWPCFFGMDTGNPDELVANRIPDPEELRQYLGVSSLEYLSLDGLRSAAADSAAKLCMACMDGRYPESIDLPVELRKK